MGHWDLESHPIFEHKNLTILKFVWDREEIPSPKMRISDNTPDASSLFRMDLWNFQHFQRSFPDGTPWVNPDGFPYFAADHRPVHVGYLPGSGTSSMCIPVDSTRRRCGKPWVSSSEMLGFSIAISIAISYVRRVSHRISHHLIF